MKRQNAFSQRSRRLVSCLFFGGMLLATPPSMADKPTMSQTGSGSSGSSASPSRPSQPSASSGSSRSSGGASRSSASSGRSSASPRASRPSARAPNRTNSGKAPGHRRGVRQQRKAGDNPPAQSQAASSRDHASRNHGSHHSGDHRRRHHYGYGGRGYHHYHHAGCGHYGYGYYGYGYPYRYYGPFGYIYHHPSRLRYSGSGYYGEDMGALDLDVRPEKAQVFVDGTLVGVADQYDGFPAYLWLEKGTYDVVIYKEGYETISRQYSVYPGVVIDVEDRMVAGTAVKPEDLYAKTTTRRDARIRRNEEMRAAARQRPGGDIEMRQESSGGSEQDVGRLLLNVTPSDAAAYLDGHFLGTAGELAQLSAGLVVEPGDHILEIVRPGYSTERVPIQIPAGDKITIDLELAAR